MEIESITQLLSGYDNALFGSFAVSVLIVVLGKVYFRFSSSEKRGYEVQTSHVGLTPRIGGIAILSGCVYGWYGTENFSSNYLGYIILSGIPVLTLGLLDDFYFKISPIYRLMGASISSVIAIILLQTWIDRVDIIFVDQLFLLAPFAVLFTIALLVGCYRVLMVFFGPEYLAYFTPVGALALFGGASFNKHWQAFLFPILILFLSDVVLMYTVYAPFRTGLL